MHDKDDSWQLPPGAYDTHVHVFDRQLGPYDPHRAYTPDEAPLADLLVFSAGLSSSSNATQPAHNLVLVQPSPYGTDNRVLLAALSRLREAEKNHASTGVVARAIVVLDLARTSDAELHRLHDLGVRGLRLNLQAAGRAVDHDALAGTLREAADRIRHLPGWKVQVYCPAPVWDDHLGGLKGYSKLSADGSGSSNESLDTATLEQPGFRSLVRLAEKFRVAIKISGLYRASDSIKTGYDDLAPIVRALAERVPDRLVWASDWPHTGEGKDRKPEDALIKTESFRIVDNIRVLKHIRAWLGSDEVWYKVMVSNPKTLYS